MQNKGGGHGEIGFHLAKNLADKDLTVTIVQDSAAKKEALPFSKYGELPSSVNVEWVDTSDASAVEAACGDKATHVFDNNSKKPGDAAPIISAAKKSDAFYSFVSSAGMYAAKGMLKEEKKVKDPPTGQREVEICVEINQCVGCWLRRAVGNRHRHAIDAMIQHERAVNFDFHTVVDDRRASSDRIVARHLQPFRPSVGVLLRHVLEREVRPVPRERLP